MMVHSWIKHLNGRRPLSRLQLTDVDGCSQAQKERERQSEHDSTVL